VTLFYGVLDARNFLLRNGSSYIGNIEQGLREWMEEHEYELVDRMQDSMSQMRCSDPGAFERAQYMCAVKDIGYVRCSGTPMTRKVEDWGPQ
jgi:hypothetical protein